MTSYISWDNKYKTTPAYISKVGESAGKMYGFIYDGTYKYEDFNKTIDENGKEVYTLKEGIPYYVAGTQPGDPKYRDLTGEGEINDKDKTTIGNGAMAMISSMPTAWCSKTLPPNKIPICLPPILTAGLRKTPPATYRELGRKVPMNTVHSMWKTALS